jgi:hypothetical protein
MKEVLERQQACINARIAASAALLKSLKVLAAKGRFSEAQVRDSWVKAMGNDPELFPSGWYVPPPQGIGVLFGEATRESRHNYTSLRPTESWPREDLFFDEPHPLMYAYASPVNKHTGIIGDFGITIYTAEDPDIQKHIQQCLQINRDIFEFIAVGKSFAEVYRYAHELFQSLDLSNRITSVTDLAAVNIGHTVPAVDTGWNEDERKVLQRGKADWNAAASLISKKRLFLNGIEQTTYQPGMAVTLEPRLVNLKKPHIPMASFHTIVLIHPDGSKELCTDFDALFAEMGMGFMLD